MTHQNVDPHIELEHILDRFAYPKDRDEIVEDVRTAGHDDAVVTLIVQLPAGTYASAHEVLAAIPKWAA